MARKDLLDHLAEVPMFTPCSKQELRELSRLATEVDIPVGKVLTKEGTPGREFVIILDGTAVATKNGRKVATLGPGDYFGEIALLDPGPRTATVTSTTPMTVFVLNAGEFSQALADVPALSGKIMRGLARRLRDVENPKVV